MFTGFVYEPTSCDKKHTDAIWQYFLSGNLTSDGNARKTSPNFGSELMILAVLASIAKEHNASERTNKIITQSNGALEGLENKLTDMSKLKKITGYLTFENVGCMATHVARVGQDHATTG